MKQKIIYSAQGDDFYVSYTFDDQPVVHTELNGPSAELSRKYQFAIKELEVTFRYLMLASKILTKYTGQMDPQKPLHIFKMEPEDETVAQSLFSAATVSYGKLFMGVGQGRKQFQPRDFFAKDGKKYSKLHAWWMDVRNNYIAHSAGTPYDDARVVLLLPPPFVEDKSWWWCFSHVRFHRTPQPHIIEDLSEMVEFMLKIMQSKQDRLIKHIASNITLPKIQSYRSSAVYASICTEMPPAPPIGE